MTPTVLSAQIGADMLWDGLLVLCRVGGVIGLAPVFGEQIISLRLRLVAALAFTLCLLPLVPVSDHSQRLGALMQECVVGIVWGLLLRLMVTALQMAGAVAAQAMSLAQIAGPAAGADPSPAIGNLFFLGGLALAASGGLHLGLLTYLLESYSAVPLGPWQPAGLVAEAGLAMVARMTAAAFSLSLPFAALALSYNILMGIMNRAMPQMMVVFIGAPVIVGASLLALALLAPLLLSLWRDALFAFLVAPQVLR